MGGNGPKLGHFGPKWRHRPKFRESGHIFFLQKFIKIISVRFMVINLVKSVINGVNLVKIGHFWWKWSKIGSFWAKMAPQAKI